MTEPVNISAKTVISFHNISKRFKVKGGLFSKKNEYVHALRNINIEIPEGITYGIVGESGSGKSTLARVFMGLYPPSEGYFIFENSDSRNFSKESLKVFRRNVSMVFQDPYSSLNPRMKVKQILAEPLKIHNIGSKAEKEKKILQVIDQVGLSAKDLNKFPHEFSGGQRQRIGIARALIIEPKVMVLDEPVSALDVSIQAQILNLLADIKKENNLTLIFIAHDLSVVEYLSDRVAVMYLGKILEEHDAQTIFKNPKNPYTRTLIETMPDISKTGHDFKVISGEIPSPINPPPGCPFEPRCDRKSEACSDTFPDLQEFDDTRVYCHHPL